MDDFQEKSKHFLSLDLFTKFGEPPLSEIISEKRQLELELKQREEEDALYRSFLKDRRDLEEQVINLSDEERDAAFELANKKERSRIINMVTKHSSQMMDFVYREKVDFFEKNGDGLKQTPTYPKNEPPLHAPGYTKLQIYENIAAVFEAVDDQSIKGAKREFRTYTSLVKFLAGYLTSELERARVLFRFITEKEFEYKSWFLYYPEEGNKRGSPLTLFRGVEFGIESKALLYKKLCAYAGLHAIVIQGFEKGKDFMPGETFHNNKWRTAWNAVYCVDGWRLVQTNWASLKVNTKALHETRKIYQDHFFATEPDEFIYQFYPINPDHQFLDHPISRDEFEDLPILRSTFFHHGIRLSRNEGLLSSVVKTDRSGQAHIYMKSKKNVLYHYSLTEFIKGSSSLSFKRKRIPLDRYVMLTRKEEDDEYEATFSFYIPKTGEYLLHIGCAQIPKTNFNPMSAVPYINIAKFKIVCEHTQKDLRPLPNCAPGEWGPLRALSMFGLNPISHRYAEINAAPPSNIDIKNEVRPLTLNIEFESTQPVLDFVTKLYKNDSDRDTGMDAKFRMKGNIIIFDVKIPELGQYGLDIYTRKNWEDKMVHCCKYLINYEL